MVMIWGGSSGLNSTKEAGQSVGTFTTVVASGSRARQNTGFTSATRQFELFSFAGAAADGPYWFKIDYIINAYPSIEVRIAESCDALAVNTNNAWYVTLHNDGKLRLYSDAGVVGSPSSKIPLGTRVSLLVHFDKTPGAGSQQLDAQLGTEFGTPAQFAAATNLTFTRQVMSLVIGGNLGLEAQTAGDWKWMDAQVNDSTGAFETGFPTPGYLIYLFPTAVGDNGAWTKAGSSPAATDWQSVNEVPPDDAVTFLSSNTLNQLDDMLIGTAPTLGASDVIAWLAVGCRRAGAAASANATFQLRLKASSGGTVGAGTGIQPQGVTWACNASTNGKYTLVAATQPGTSNVWTSAVVATSQVGVTLTPANTNASFVSGIWLLVKVTPGAVTAGTTPIPNYARASIPARSSIPVRSSIPTRSTGYSARRDNRVLWNGRAPALFKAQHAQVSGVMPLPWGIAGSAREAGPVGRKDVFSCLWNRGAIQRFRSGQGKTQKDFYDWGVAPEELDVSSLIGGVDSLECVCYNPNDNRLYFGTGPLISGGANRSAGIPIATKTYIFSIDFDAAFTIGNITVSPDLTALLGGSPTGVIGTGWMDVDPVTNVLYMSQLFLSALVTLDLNSGTVATGTWRSAYLVNSIPNPYASGFAGQIINQKTRQLVLVPFDPFFLADASGDVTNRGTHCVAVSYDLTLGAAGIAGSGFPTYNAIDLVQQFGNHHSGFQCGWPVDDGTTNGYIVMPGNQDGATYDHGGATSLDPLRGNGIYLAKFAGTHTTFGVVGQWSFLDCSQCTGLTGRTYADPKLALAGSSCFESEDGAYVYLPGIQTRNSQRWLKSGGFVPSALEFADLSQTPGLAISFLPSFPDAGIQWPYAYQVTAARPGDGYLYYPSAGFGRWLRIPDGGIGLL